MLRFYNTLTRKKEEFIPVNKGKVGMYTCGPTVYDYAHLGNFRAYIFEDILRRFLKYKGYKVTQIMNITDIDDKTIAGAKREGIKLAEFTKRYIAAFFEDLKTLNIEPAEHYPRATEHIDDMVGLIKKILDKGFAYQTNGSVYFRIQSFKNYGQLSRMNLGMIKPGTRVDRDEYDKKDVRDFVLWKSRKEGEPFWKTELGSGRPGWHIECSAMSVKYLGQPFDIHTGGEDNIFPHHENEIAQSEAASGKKFVNFWLHCKFLLVNGEKMAKSKGNFFTLRDILKKGYSPRAIRYLLASTHYRVPLNFTFEGLKAAQKTIDRLIDFLARLREYQPAAKIKKNKELSRKIAGAKKGFERAMDNNLNISEALSYIFDLMKEVNICLDKKVLDRQSSTGVIELFKKVDSILGVLKERPLELNAQIKDLVNKREEARKKGDFGLADQIRNKIFSLGIIVEDTPEGARYRKRHEGKVHNI